MCGRYSISTDLAEVAKRFRAAEPAMPWLPRFNAAPTQELPVILNEPERRLQALRWGMIPYWAKDPSIGNRMINARAESLVDKPSFKVPLKKRRCLVPADGFYEWQKTGQGKVPMRVVLKSGEPFAFAGLWDTWRDRNDPSAEKVRSFTIVTTTPNELLADIHDRMPAMLLPEHEDVWLSEGASPDDLLGLLGPYPADALRVYPVSRRVNDPAHDDASIVTPVA